MTPLHVAMSTKKIELVELLLAHQADINVADVVRIRLWIILYWICVNYVESVAILHSTMRPLWEAYLFFIYA